MLPGMVCSEFIRGFRNASSRAMACGCAVVSTACGGPEDIIENGVNGILVDKVNYGKMVEEIVELYKDSDKREKIREEAKKTVARFSWDNAIAKLETSLTMIHDNSIRSL